MWYEVNIKERRRRFVNSSSTLKNFLLLLNRNAFDLNLKATQLSDDKEFYIEMALRWNFTSCRQRWCFKKKKKERRSLQGLYSSGAAADAWSSLANSCCHLTEFPNPWIVLNTRGDGLTPLLWRFKKWMRAAAVGAPHLQNDRMWG